jgi:methionyl-tRNA formyltransferase
MEEGLDAGPLYLERRLAIGDRETAGELSARLASAGAELLVRTLRGLAEGSLTARPQQGEPSFCGSIRRADAEVDWNRSATELERRLRAYTPWPGLFTFLDGERIKILEAGVWKGGIDGEPGSFAVDRGELVVAAGGGSALRLDRLQRAGRKPVTGAEFARAARLPGRFQSAR